MGLMPAFVSGCTAVSSSDGDTTIYRNSVLLIVGVLAISIAFLVFGVGIFLESFQAIRAKPKRSRSGKRKRKPAAQGKAWGGVCVGVGLTLIGLIVLLMGVPSAALAYVEVGPERVVIRDQLFWFATSPAEYSYSSISNIDHEEITTLSRRGTRKKQILYLTHTGGVERIEMVPIHLAARERLEQAWRDYRNGSNAEQLMTDGSTSELGESDPGTQTASSSTAAIPQTQPIDHRTDVGQTFTTTVTGGTFGHVYGTDIYTIDSPLSAAAVHAGILQAGETAEVTFRILPGQAQYEGTDRHGVRSFTWPQYDASYEFVTTAESETMAARSSPSDSASSEAIVAGELPRRRPQKLGDSPNLTSVPVLGRFKVGSPVGAKGADGRVYRAKVIQPYQEKKFLVRYETGPDTGDTAVVELEEVFPSSAATVPPATDRPNSMVEEIGQVQVGMTLMAHYDGEWYPVKVVGIRGSKVTIQWPLERSPNTVPLKYVRFPTP